MIPSYRSEFPWRESRLNLAILVFLLVLTGFKTLCMAEDRVTITNVSVHPQFFYSGKKEAPKITYKLSQDASATIKIYQENDFLIKTLVHSKNRSKGDHSELWDGTDNRGQPVPPGIYRFTITAGNKAGESVLSDLTELTGGAENQVALSEIDVGQGIITYVLKSPCLVISRLGLKDGGPVLRTLEYRKAKPAGFNQVPWDGFDNSGAVNFLHHPKLSLHIQAYSLSANSIVVVGSQQLYGVPASVLKKDEEKRMNKKTIRKIIRSHRQHISEKCRDPKVKIILPPDIERDPNGIPVIRKPLHLKVTVSEQDRLPVTEERFEVMFFVDFFFAYEQEAGFFPYNWTWNPQGVTKGIHYVTVNIVGYEGHIGSASIKVKFN